jgi:uncharacterized protein (TIGR03905 family)
MTQTYYPQGTCSTEIRFEVADGVLCKVEFTDGCNGNLTGIGRLVTGMKVEDVITKLKGIPCEGRDTSCPDQLARALEHWLSAGK